MAQLPAPSMPALQPKQEPAHALSVTLHPQNVQRHTWLCLSSEGVSVDEDSPSPHAHRDPTYTHAPGSQPPASQQQGRAFVSLTGDEVVVRAEVPSLQTHTHDAPTFAAEDRPASLLPLGTLRPGAAGQAQHQPQALCLDSAPPPPSSVQLAPAVVPSTRPAASSQAHQALHHPPALLRQRQAACHPPGSRREQLNLQPCHRLASSCKLLQGCKPHRPACEHSPAPSSLPMAGQVLCSQPLSRPAAVSCSLTACSPLLYSSMPSLATCHRQTACCQAILSHVHRLAAATCVLGPCSQHLSSPMHRLAATRCILEPCRLHSCSMEPGCILLNTSLPATMQG